FAVNNATKRINEKKEHSYNKLLVTNFLNSPADNDMIGIPTIEGFEFIPIQEIIRCEGLQKCTRVITVDRSDIISSYNLGEFRKMLEPHGFYSPHKSHLINLKFIRKYHKEGNIMLINNSYVPVAKRKKKEFLS
ncbi:MAG: LytTR family transcriptional regulator, partial [Bacteroidales bacterium]|nr:LytTR family transcriptional regulator [Bacteroidales bacterium]